MSISVTGLVARRWEDDLAALAADVTALYEHPGYRRIAGDARTPGLLLEGASRREGEITVARVRSLLVGFEGLRVAVEQAGLLHRPTPPPLRSALDGASLANPHLPDESASPAAVRDAMVTNVRAVHSSLGAFANAWTDLPSLLDSCVAELAALQDRSVALGIAFAPASLTAALDRVRLAGAADPLGAMAELQREVAPKLGRIAADLSAREHQRDETQRQLELARREVERLRGAHATAVTSIAERDARLTDDSRDALVSLAELQALLDWREKLAGSANAGHWAAVGKALETWRERAAELAEHIASTSAAAREAIDERRRLRGWLVALNAKAGALRRAEDAAFCAPALEAHRLLHLRPTPMPRVRALLETCQSVLAHER